MTAVKTNPGNFFEDFKLGQVLRHATPRTVTTGDVALYTALTGSRFAFSSSDEFAKAMGLNKSPLDDVLAFHFVFGKTVPDVSLNAVANLGYANCKFFKPVYPGDTITTTSKVIGLRQLSNGKAGVVYVHSTGVNQEGAPVIDYVRWVMVNKRNQDLPAPETVIPELSDVVPATELAVPESLNGDDYDTVLAGSPYLWEDYQVGEKIDHVDGFTIEEAEHQMATRLYQNTAKVHFDQCAADKGRFGKRLMYGGHVISMVRSLSFNGLANAFKIAAINGGSHVAPMFAGDTIYAWSEVLDKAEISGRSDVGALRIRSVGVKNQTCGEFPYKSEDGKYADGVVLDIDYWTLMPRQP